MCRRSLEFNRLGAVAVECSYNWAVPRNRSSVAFQSQAGSIPLRSSLYRSIPSPRSNSTLMVIDRRHWRRPRTFSTCSSVTARIRGVRTCPIHEHEQTRCAYPTLIAALAGRNKMSVLRDQRTSSTAPFWPIPATTRTRGPSVVALPDGAGPVFPETSGRSSSALRQVAPQLKAVILPCAVALALLAGCRCRPSSIARRPPPSCPCFPGLSAVLNRPARTYVMGFNPTVRMPRQSARYFQFVRQSVQQQNRSKSFVLPNRRAAQLHSSPPEWTASE